jgi:membrane associated rhomboid family serine protease
MLDDRSYMRSDSRPARWSMTVTLLVVNVVCFLVQNLVGKYSNFPIFDYFALSTEGLKHGFVWQLITFQFMHGGFLHLLFNSIAIFFFGRAIEETLGPKTFLKLYFSSGVIGGLIQILVATLVPHRFGHAVVGASAGGFGLIAAFATLFPERSLTLLLFFIIPINMKAKVLLLIEGAITVWGIVFPSSGIAHAAHLGGMLTGIAYIRFIVLSNHAPIRWRPFGRTPSVRELVNANSARRPTWRRTKTTQTGEELPSAEFISREVDPILDKISAHGIHSLTEQERQILDAARKKMAKR